MRITVEKWQCDRCQIVLDHEPVTTSDTPKVSLSGGIYYATAAGPSFNFKDLCDECGPVVERQIDEIVKSAAILRSKAKPSQGDEK